MDTSLCSRPTVYPRRVRTAIHLSKGSAGAFDVCRTPARPTVGPGRCVGVSAERGIPAMSRGPHGEAVTRVDAQGSLPKTRQVVDAGQESSHPAAVDGECLARDVAGKVGNEE